MFVKGNTEFRKRKERTFTCASCFTCFTGKHGNSKLCVICRKKHYEKYWSARRKGSIEGTLESVVAGCRYRAKRKAMDCNIDSSFIKELYKKQNGKCAVTGIVLTVSNAQNKRNSSPWTVSVDRIDNTRGYTKDNVRLVCYMYNSAHGQWTDSDVEIMCRGVLKL